MYSQYKQKAWLKLTSVAILRSIVLNTRTKHTIGWTRVLEFIAEQEISSLFDEMGLVTTPGEGGEMFISMKDELTLDRHCLCNEDVGCECQKSEQCFPLAKEQVVDSTIAAIHKIHRGQTVLMPVGKWRGVFDAVAFKMAADETWQTFDATATVRLNTQDPLLFETADEHTLSKLITALMNDGDEAEQGVYMLAVGVPMIMHISPGGPVILCFGNQALADEISEAYSMSH